MTFAPDQRLVVAVASSALFDLAESDEVFWTRSLDDYRAFQREREDVPLPPGVAFEFVRRLLAVGGPDDEGRPAEVVLLSRNDPDTGARVMRSIAHHGLPVRRAAFLGGGEPWRYLDAFGASLFLSADDADVRRAIAVGCPAGRVLPSSTGSPGADGDDELRIAFDFDCVLAGDEGERAYRAGGLEHFRAHEAERRMQAIAAGPLAPLFARLAALQAHERARMTEDPAYRPVVRTAIVTARGAPTHERVVTTLRAWGIMADETFFLDGAGKARVLGALRPHLFFDDQRTHLDAAATVSPVAHVPFGPANE